MCIRDSIISWNLWQMDGLHLSVPGGKPQPAPEQLDLFSMFGAAEPQPPTVSCNCLLYTSLTSKYSGTEVKVDGEECTIVRQGDILAVVEDLSLIHI